MGATYTNTDLVIRARFDPVDLVAALSARLDSGVVTCWNRVWQAMFEAPVAHNHPAQAIEILLDAVRDLEPETRKIWEACLERRIDVGWTGCDDAFYSRWRIGPKLLQRLVEENIHLVVTIYRQSEKSVPSDESGQENGPSPKI